MTVDTVTVSPLTIVSCSILLSLFLFIELSYGGDDIYPCFSFPFFSLDFFTSLCITVFPLSRWVQCLLLSFDLSICITITTYDRKGCMIQEIVR